MRPILVYIAGPYRVPDSCLNTNKAIHVAETVVAAGLVPVIPHLSHFWHTMVPHPVDFWLEYDLHLMRRCDAVLRFSGFSSGADAEVAEANRLGIPVFFNLDELVQWASNR